jgi:hypothetical protein
MSCCGSLFVNLGGGGGGTVNTGVLQIAGGVALDATLRFVEDQAGTNSVFKLSTIDALFTAPLAIATTIDRQLSFQRSIANEYSIEHDISRLYFYNRSTGNVALNLDNAGAVSINTFTISGALTITGKGGNIASFRNASDVQVAQIDSVGSFLAPTILVGTGGFLSNATGSRLNSTADGNWLMQNLAQNNFTALLLGGTTNAFPAIASTNTPAALAAKDATGANLIPFSAEDFTSANLSTGALTTARPMQFGDKAAISDAGLTALGLNSQIAVEHNGSVYYIPCSTSQFT